MDQKAGNSFSQVCRLGSVREGSGKSPRPGLSFVFLHGRERKLTGSSRGPSSVVCIPGTAQCAQIFPLCKDTSQMN